jgi:hypothetical protein
MAGLIWEGASGFFAQEHACEQGLGTRSKEGTPHVLRRCLSVLSGLALFRRRCNQGAFDEAVHLAISRYQCCGSHKRSVSCPAFPFAKSAMRHCPQRSILAGEEQLAICTYMYITALVL